MKDFKEYQKLLKEFVEFESVSTDPRLKGQIDACVGWLKNLFIKNGFTVEIWKGKNSNPVIFAAFAPDKNAKTVLVYGHYDVQPASVNDGWEKDPYTLRASKGKLLGRGVVDNKGQIMAHIFAVLKLAKKRQLKYNVKFIIEGNEETGNPDLAGLMRTNKKKLKCDILIVSDGELANDKPTIEVSLRGGFNCTLSYKTGKNNLHSGIFGGAAPNAATEMAKFLGKLFTDDGSINFKDFYKNVDKITPSDLARNKKLAKEGKDMADLAGVKALICKNGADYFTQTGLRPTIEITGLKTGYIDAGYANIIPAEAEVRLNVRTVASQKAEDIAKKLEDFIRLNTPDYVDYKFSTVGLHDPVKISTGSPFFTEMEKILETVYKSKVNRKNVGGAVPFVGDVKEILGVDTLLVPMGNEDCNMHGVSENFDVELAKKAIELSWSFFSSRYHSDKREKPNVVRKKK